jgi:hypothetical protein
MDRIRGTVTYKDEFGGGTEDFEGGAGDIAAYEEWALRYGGPMPDVIMGNDRLPKMTMVLVIAHSALGIEEGYSVWRRKVSTFEFDTEEVPPTLPAPTDASWPS